MKLNLAYRSCDLRGSDRGGGANSELDLDLSPSRGIKTYGRVALL
jgi:hypothetical protein